MCYSLRCHIWKWLLLLWHKTKLSGAVDEYEEEYGVKHNILWPFLERQIFLLKKKNPLHGHPMYLNSHIRYHTDTVYVTVPDEVQKEILQQL